MADVEKEENRDEKKEEAEESSRGKEKNSTHRITTHHITSHHIASHHITWHGACQHVLCVAAYRHNLLFWSYTDVWIHRIPQPLSDLPRGETQMMTAVAYVLMDVSMEGGWGWMRHHWRERRDARRGRRPQRWSWMWRYDVGYPWCERETTTWKRVAQEACGGMRYVMTYHMPHMICAGAAGS